MVPDTIKAGSVVAGRFEVGAVIGSGTFGVVYRAHDRDAGRAVALKTLRPNAFAVPDLVERFGREAEICEQLVHPNTARLLHVGKHPTPEDQPDMPFMVMELVRGLPLGGLVGLRGRLRPEETAHVLSSVLDSLQQAHMAGIIHRDLKPNNILIVAPDARCIPPLDSGDLFARLGVPGAEDPIWRDLRKLQVKVVDFGLGKVLEVGGRQVKRLTAAGIAAGTAEYMSPEQVKSRRDIDHRADIYGVSMLMYRLLVGEPCYSGSNLVEVATKHVTEPLPRLPGELDMHPIAAVYRKAGEKDRVCRYASAAEMAWHLRASVDSSLAVQEPPDFDLPPSPQEASLNPSKRSFWSRLFGR